MVPFQSISYYIRSLTEYSYCSTPCQYMTLYLAKLEEDEIYQEVLDLVRVATSLLAMVKKQREQVA